MEVFWKCFYPPTESQEEDGDIEVEEAEGEENDRPYNLRQRKTVERYQAPPIGEEPDNAWPTGLPGMWEGNSWMAASHPWQSNREAALCVHPDLLWMGHSLSVSVVVAMLPHWTLQVLPCAGLRVGDEWGLGQEILGRKQSNRLGDYIEKIVTVTPSSLLGW